MSVDETSLLIDSYEIRCAYLLYRGLEARGKLSESVDACLAKKRARIANPPLERWRAVAELQATFPQRLRQYKAERAPKPVALGLRLYSEITTDLAAHPSRAGLAAIIDSDIDDNEAVQFKTEVTSSGDRFLRFYVSSWARKLGASTLELHYRGKTKIVKLPRGWEVFVGAWKLCIGRKSGSARYRHTFEMSDAWQGARALVNAARADEAERKQQLKKRLAAIRDYRKLLSRAASLGITISIEDSFAAGNCESGTLEWIRVNGLDPARQYPVAKIARLGARTSYPNLVRLAVLQAVKRSASAMWFESVSAEADRLSRI